MNIGERVAYAISAILGLSLTITFICWFLFGDSITQFYQIHIDENFGRTENSK